MRAWNQPSHDPKTQPSRKRCVLLHCIARRRKSQATNPYCQVGVFVTAMVKIQWPRWSLTSKQGSNWQHLLQQASLYSQHIMMTALHHNWQKIFNQQPRFVEIFWISISSATTGKNFWWIDHHLSELLKKEKGRHLYETPCILCNACSSTKKFWNTQHCSVCLSVCLFLPLWWINVFITSLYTSERHRRTNRLTPTQYAQFIRTYATIS